ncbi:hypothetical protein C4572_00460 [Candidatus Parcubacteria bacterium]|nr:MAG: hypothetical protein C4572_00460 [Candidatus Parcubacteria bacterium]
MVYDLIIIGGATSGLTAGIYAARKKLNAIIVTREVGGQTLLTETIENFPGFEKISGPELIARMETQVKKLKLPVIKTGISSLEKTADGQFVAKTDKGDEMKAKAIIVTTGKNPRRLDVPGEKEFENKGVVYCSTCDAPLFGGKTVAVAGGGNSGLNAAYDLLKYAVKIYVMEAGGRIIGDEVLQDKLKESGIVEFMTNVDIKEIAGRNFVDKVVYLDKKNGQTGELAVQGVFVNVGWVPATGFLKGVVDLNDYGEIIIDPANQTSTPGIFAAGDATNVKYKQCIIAAGEGAKAALAAYDYLKLKSQN